MSALQKNIFAEIRATTAPQALDIAPALDLAEELRSEAIDIVCEAAGAFQNPVLLFSGGKDSMVLLDIAAKAFAPHPLPFALLHVDTGHNFPEIMAFRDRMVTQYGVHLIVASVQDSIDRRRVVERRENESRNAMQAVTLTDVIAEYRIDACFGGARRDEEKARAKERIFSHRDEFGAWDPRNQRPEPWGLFNTRLRFGENIRVFPLSNWTELDIWRYIAAEELELPPVYFAHERDVIQRSGLLFPVTPLSEPSEGETVERLSVRFRTVGDMSCTCPIRSTARTVEEVIDETLISPNSERGETRADDALSESAMENRKKAGYF
jgi:sulfate adenylyltransferase subunit 2